MFKYNDNHIFSGYIKQLLASFNLTKARVYTNDDEVIVSNKSTTKNGYPINMSYFPYIKDDTIQYCIKKIKAAGQWQLVWENTNKNYYYNKKELNKTKTLEIKNNYYDSYTHEYLGNYLRFLRDYKHFDLMPLYNCFSDVICTDVKYEPTALGAKPFKIDSSDSNYKIYMFPVKFFKQYTIAIESDTSVEICCGIYGKYQNNTFDELAEKTYVKYANMRFEKPQLFHSFNLDNESTPEDLAKFEDDLKMFIKLPITNDSSIVVLEGNYIGWNDKVNDKQNHFITNFEGPVDESGQHIGYQENQYFVPITQLQLLRQNTKVSHPFADRLIEYLVGNTITDASFTTDIKNIQDILTTRGFNLDIEGAWESKIRPASYDFINNTKKLNVQEINHDILGYIDKDVEKNLTSK